MGIKGTWSEVGKIRSISLAKLATQKYEECGRPLRAAVDTPIWLFQIKAGRGGSNPALRTLYYRLIRLLSLSIQLLFVFDGPDKPPFKRNAQTGTSESIEVPRAKELIDLFGFRCHTAPGEAEAECALLQRSGVVDIVWSEDVDTIAFGATHVMRSSSSEGPRAAKEARTHVELYESQAINSDDSGLNREGLILVALMSGGDYLPGGVPRCGVKVASEAARAGFGHELLEIPVNDTAKIQEWRERLRHELLTNESKFFRTKHKALLIPDSFPDPKIQSYYTSPVVSSTHQLQQIKEKGTWNGKVNVVALRAFVRRNFEWHHYQGAKKLIRGLAPSLLSQSLWSQSFAMADRDQPPRMSTNRTAIKVTDHRKHFETGGIPELKISFIPADVVGLDLANETIGEVEEELSNSSSESEEILEKNAGSSKSNLSPSKRDLSPSKSNLSPLKRNRAPSKYDPLETDKVWIPETYVRRGARLEVEDWERQVNERRKAQERKPREKGFLAKSGMKAGALDRYVKISKPATQARPSAIKAPLPRDEVSSRPLPCVTPSTPTKQGRKVLTPIASPMRTPKEVEKTFQLPSYQKQSRMKSLKESSQINVIDLSEEPCEWATPINSREKVAGSGPRPRPDITEDTLTSAPRMKSTGISFIMENSQISPGAEKVGAKNSLHPGQSSTNTPHSPGKKRVIIRSSLQGAWRTLDESEGQENLSENCFSGVEILDLTQLS